eukprot:TRINITY_DN7947_c0_g1_i1.p1 TRINITY_DN7947_c0_g1~~TRINITY_DN7947_c0_g1_i1.p1  ORF type:complete len:226 (-),score=7.69 TRINITY_DN7947_c0_g1_i1:62-739(-)
MPEEECCHKCRARLTLVQRSMTCRCTHSFCETHRPSDHHNCPYDYQALGRQEVMRSLSGTKQSKKGPPPAGQCNMAYALHHPSTPRTLAYSHTLALFILGWYLLLGIIARSAPLMLKGYLISYAIARVGHVLTNSWTGAGPFLGLGIHSTSCLWSSSLFTHPITCGKLEYETLLDNVRYLLSRGKTNCMTRDLYQSRGLFAMALVVKTRLVELHNQGYRRKVYVS